MQTPAPGSTARFAEFVESFTFEQVPAPVVARTKEIIYDGIGALLAATSPQYDIGGVIERFVRETGGTPEAQVFGTPLRTSAMTAALVNGMLEYYCDVESHHTPTIMHAIAVAGPAAFAVGERHHRSGRDVLAAIVVGCEVACRVSAALGPEALYARGFHPTCVAGTFGAMAAATRLLGLRGQALLNAFGLAGTVTSGLLAWASDHTEHSRPFNMGLAAYHGTFAAHLASCGCGGPPAIFEGKYPLGQAFTGKWNEAALFDGLGERFAMTEMAFKRFACCAFIHPGLDGLMDIQQKDGVRAEDIRAITLRYPSGGYKVIDGNPLRSHCAQYVLALAAHKGHVDFADIRFDRRETDAAIRSLAERVTVIGDDELNRTYPQLYRSIIEVETAGGARHARDVTHPRGTPETPMTSAELQAKFRMLTREMLPPGRQDEILRTVERMEELADVGALVRLLAPVGGTM